MKLYDGWMKAFEKRDFDEVMKYYHRDYSFVRHQTNTVMSLSEWSPLMKSMLESNKLEMISSKCCYENDDILVTHRFIDFPSGDKEAVMGVMLLKNGKGIRMETGATPMPS